MENGYTITENLLEKENITATFAAKDCISPGAICAINQKGLIKRESTIGKNR